MVKSHIIQEIDLNYLAKLQIPFFPQISNLQVTNLRSLIFVLNLTHLFTIFSQHQKQRVQWVNDRSQLLQYS